MQFDCGFLTYKIEAKECFLADMYIVPEKRGTGAFGVFIECLAVQAKSKGCDHISATIFVDDGVTRCLKAALKLDFRIKSAQNNCILMIKNIGGL